MILAIINSKGGVGKTTTAVNLSVSLAERQRRTLLVDLDAQAHATRSLLAEAPERTVTELLMDRPSQAAKAVSPSQIPNLDIVPATAQLTETVEVLSARIRREERLARALESLAGDYRHIVIDCPPTVGVLTYNAIMAADLLIIPVQPGAGAVAGLDALIGLARELRDVNDVPYRILVTMFDIRTTRTNAMVQELLDEHRRHLLKTVISKSESLNQASLAGKPISQFTRSSRGWHEYEALCDELLRLRIRP